MWSVVAAEANGKAKNLVFIHLVDGAHGVNELRTRGSGGSDEEALPHAGNTTEKEGTR